MPYMGLLTKVALADVFVLQDDLQYVKQEWQNRNRIRTAGGWRWLTLAVRARSTSRIGEVLPAEPDWPARHERVLQAHYGAASARASGLFQLAASMQRASLAAINEALLRELMVLFGVDTPVVRQSDLHLTAAEQADKNTRLVSLCARLGCDTYLSGSAARPYLNEAAWARSGRRVLIMEYCQTPYRQLHDGWIPNLSALDALLCMPEPAAYLRQECALASRRLEQPWLSLLH